MVFRTQDVFFDLAKILPLILKPDGITVFRLVDEAGWPCPSFVPPAMPRVKVTAFGFLLVPDLFGDTFTVSLLVVFLGSPRWASAVATSDRDSTAARATTRVLRTKSPPWSK